jgi:hypothetical protein
MHVRLFNSGDPEQLGHLSFFYTSSSYSVNHSVFILQLQLIPIHRRRKLHKKSDTVGTYD